MPKRVMGRDARRNLRPQGTQGDAGASLRRWRVWFDDKEGDPLGKKPEQGSNEGGPDLTGLPEWVRQMLEKTQGDLKAANHESAQRRLEIDTLSKQVQALTAGQKKQLEEDGKFKELADQYAAEIAMLKPHQERAEALDKTIRESNARRMNEVPETMRGLVPVDYAPEKLAAWLDLNWANLTQKRAPDLDAGVGGGSGRKTLPQLTDTERRIARMSGMTDEQYAEYRAKGQPSTEEI
jgi:hypothetical protein